MRKNSTISKKISKRNPVNFSKSKNLFITNEILFALDQLIYQPVIVEIKKPDYLMKVNGILNILTEMPGWYGVLMSSRASSGNVIFNGEKVFMIDFKRSDRPIIVLEKDRSNLYIEI